MTKYYGVEIPVHTIFVCCIEAENEEEAKKGAMEFFLESGRYEKDYYDIKSYNALNTEADVIAYEMKED